MNFDGDAACALARQFLALAEQQKATAPIMIGHRLLGNTLLCMGDVAEALSHLDRAWALYDPAVHRPLAIRFGHDVEWLAWPFGHWLCGCSAIPRQPCGNRPCDRRGARDRSHANAAVCVILTALHSYLLQRSSAAIMHQDECIALAQGKVRSAGCSPPLSVVASWPKPAKRLTQSKRSVPRSPGCAQSGQRHWYPLVGASGLGLCSTWEIR